MKATALFVGLMFAIAMMKNRNSEPDFSELVPVYNEFEIAMTPDAVYAFLFAIGCCETSLSDMQSGKAYTTFYGGSQFYNMSDHPVITGEKRGIVLPDEMCANAGFGPGCVSTAAGALQINKPTWLYFRGPNRFGPRLTDFSEGSQLELGRRILEYEGAIPFIESGDIGEAVYIASSRWASLPNSTSGQRKVSLETFMRYYQIGLESAQ